MQHFAPLFQKQLPGGRKARTVSAAVKKLNIKVAFQLVNGVAQRGGRFLKLCRRCGKAPLFFQRIQNNEDIQQWFHRRPLTVRYFPLTDYSIGMTSGSGY